MFKKVLFFCALILSSVTFAADSGAVTEGTQFFAGKKIWLDDTPVSTTASGNITLVKESGRVQYIDANGSGRNVTLPAVTGLAGYSFFIVNTSTTAVDLTVKNASAATIGTIHQSEAGVFNCDGISWVGFVYTSAASGFLTADGNTTGATSAAQVLTNGIKLDAITGNTATPLAIAGKVGATNTVGNAVTVTGGAGNGTGNGAAVTLTGGASGAGATGTGGAASLVGGAAASTNGTGGAVNITGGAGAGNLNGGNVVITPGAKGNTGVIGKISLAGPVSSPVTTAQTITTSDTITLPTTGYIKLLTEAGDVTAIVLTAGRFDGERIVLINTAAHSVTFDTAATSNVADGASAVIANLTSMTLTWDATSSRWYHGN